MKQASKFETHRLSSEPWQQGWAARRAGAVPSEKPPRARVSPSPSYWLGLSTFTTHLGLSLICSWVYFWLPVRTPLVACLHRLDVSSGHLACPWVCSAWNKSKVSCGLENLLGKAQHEPLRSPGGQYRLALSFNIGKDKNLLKLYHLHFVLRTFQPRCSTHCRDLKKDTVRWLYDYMKFHYDETSTWLELFDCECSVIFSVFISNLKHVCIWFSIWIWRRSLFAFVGF